MQTEFLNEIMQLSKWDKEKLIGLIPTSDETARLWRRLTNHTTFGSIYLKGISDRVTVVLDCIEHLFSACLPTSIWCSQQVSSSEIFFLVPLNKKEVVTAAKSIGTKWVPEESTRSQIISEYGWCFETAYLEPFAAESSTTEPPVTSSAAAIGATNIAAYWTAATAPSTFMDRGAPLLLR